MSSDANADKGILKKFSELGNIIWNEN